MEKAKLLVVDDDANIRNQMKWALAQEYQVFMAEDRTEALSIFENELPPVVTLDLGLPPDESGVTEGFNTLRKILAKEPLSKIIIITGQEEKANALKAIEEGAYDFFCKPIVIDDLQVVLRRALHVAALERENRELQQKVSADAFEGILGSSPQMQEVFATLRKVAGSDVPVLLLGESGTGKELVARSIHNLSSRKKHPFVAINCGAIPENLLESELFGHEKGAFTGAHALRKGHIELAQEGTLFLDEIGDLPLNLQVKLLRFLQEQQLVRIGGRQEIPLNVRVIAATNADLQKAMEEGRFRDDLYFRLGVVSIPLPPLRQRDGDIPLLAKAFLQKYASQNKRKISGFAPQAIQAMQQYNWPGNVRELENRIKRAVIMADKAKLTAADLELDSGHHKYEGTGLKEAREALEKELIQRSLARHRGNITQAALELGISRPTLYELMGKLGIEAK